MQLNINTSPKRSGKSFQMGQEAAKALLSETNIGFIMGLMAIIESRLFNCKKCGVLGIKRDPRQEYCTNKCKQAHYRQLKRITDKYNQFFPEGQGNIITGTVDEPVHRGDMIATAVDEKGNIKFLPVQEGGKCGFVRDDKGNEYVVPLKEVRKGVYEGDAHIVLKDGFPVENGEGKPPDIGGD